MMWFKMQRLRASKDPKTRLRLVEEMVAAGDKSACGAFIDALEDEDAPVRVAAAKGLGLLREAGALNPLLNALRDRKGEVRSAACSALRQLADSQAIPHLVALLDDDDHAVRWHAASSLGAIGWKPSNNTEMMLRAVATGQHEHAACEGAKAVDILARALGDATAPRRHAAATALGKTGDSRAIKPLENALNDDDSHVRVSAIEALGNVGNEQSGALLLKILRDPNNLVRAAAVEALGRMGDERVIGPIDEFLLQDANYDVRKLSVEALGRLRNERATQLLWKALKDTDHDIRASAAQALGPIADARSIGPLALALKDENGPVRQAAKASLRQIDRQWEISEFTAAALPELEAAVNDKEYWVSQSASDALARISDARERAREAEALCDPVQQRREAAIRILIDTLGDFDRDLRQAAAEALGRINDFRGVAPLVNALDDQDTWVGRAAALALNHLNWEPAAGDSRRLQRVKTLMHMA